MGKTIYILGAGFSKGLNAPLQSEIIDDIFKIDPCSLPYELQNIFTDYRNEFMHLLNDTFYLESKDFKLISLEDIYTPLDRCLLENVSFRGIQRDALFSIKQKINALIIILIKTKLDFVGQPNYASNFAHYLVDLKKRKGKNKDPFSIFSFNWDIVIDNAIYSELFLDRPSKGILDYCCHYTPYQNNDNLLPGLLARGKGLFNIKLLKLHGSMNWLQCQRCQRLFIQFGEKIAIHEFLDKPICRLCEKNYKNDSIENRLVSQLIMPTFIKDLNNVQLKLIWQNAAIELSEATELVFLGYSFPYADFEFRQLLSRFARHEAKILAVLCERDKPSALNTDCPELRYRSFFGKRDFRISYDGVESYINNLNL